MANIPLVVQQEAIPGMTRIAQGKVRDTYALADPNLLLPLTTDRASIFDFVLPASVPQKGEVLNALNIFWSMKLDGAIPQDMVAFGKAVDPFLLPESRGNPEIHKRATVVKRQEMLSLEAIVRGYLTGSGWTAYQETAPDHLLCGHVLPSGLQDGDRLPMAVFTPSTKAEIGHDEHITVAEVRGKYGPEVEVCSLKLFSKAGAIALKRGIVMADTKMEFGKDPVTGFLTLADERFTPDASRYWLLQDWELSRKEGRSPTSFDKQFLREWGKTQGIHKRNPLVQGDVDYVHNLTVPQHILLWTRQIYRYIFYLLTHQRLEEFQRENMGIATSPLPVEVVIGSESDVRSIQPGLEWLQENKVPFRVHVISCHRNPEALRGYALDDVPDNATVIAAAGKAAALPGVLQAWLRHAKKDYIPVIGVALTNDENAADNKAAMLSIERLPGNPVVLDEGGKAYCGWEGFLNACAAAGTKEFFIPSNTKPKPAVLDIYARAAATTE